MPQAPENYTEILHVADIPRSESLCSIIGRIVYEGHNTLLQDWSGRVPVHIATPTVRPPELSVVMIKGRTQNQGLDVHDLKILAKPKSRAELEKLAGPERQIFHPDLSAAFRARDSLLAFSRDYFQERGYQAVHAPSLMAESTTDPNIALFKTRYAPLAGAGTPDTFYLQTSPELALKRALVAGAKAIYHVGSVFRNGESDATHSPEFLMLEFYRVGATLHDLMNETEAFVHALATEAKSQGFQPNPSMHHPFNRLRLPDLFSEATGVDLLKSFEGDDLANRLEAKGSGPFPEGSDYEEVFHQALVEKVQERLQSIPSSFLYDYPAPLALLSRLDESDPRIARRVEGYIGDIEIANGFEELTDAEAYRKRFLTDQAVRKSRNLPVPPLPERFLTSIASGLPPCAGIALGMDRLVQLAIGASNLSEIIPFRLPE